MNALPTLLSDGVVTLRPHRVDDVSDMVTMANDPEFVRWTTVPVPFTPQHALDRVEEGRTRWADGSVAHWAIEAGDGGTARFAGDIDIRSTPRPHIGYGLAPWARGLGVMTRAVRLAARWAFEERGHEVVHWSTYAGNLASWRVAHACGFTFHAEIPAYESDRGTMVDGWLASLRPGDPMTPRTAWWATPVLTGERVRLRPLRDSDAPRIVEACSDERTRYYLPLLPDPYTEADAQTFIRSAHRMAATGQAVNWGVADPVDDRLLGTVSVFDLTTKLDPTGGEIGYWAHPDARGRGVLTEAVGLATQHAFIPVAAGGLGRERLQIGAAWSNGASRRVAEKAGFALYAHAHLDGLVGLGTDCHQDDGAWYELLR